MLLFLSLIKEGNNTDHIQLENNISEYFNKKRDQANG